MPSKSKTNSSKTFPIIFSIIVLAMVGVVVLSVTSNNKASKAESLQEFSSNATVSPVTLDGNIGEATLPAFNEGSPDEAIGKMMPKISAQDFRGKSVDIVPGKKPYVVTVVAHWCQHCQLEVPKIVKLHENGALPNDVEFYAIAAGTSDQKPNYPPSKWLLKEEWPWTKLADDENSTIAGSLGLTGYPYLIFVNADGTVFQRLSGEQEDSTIISAAQSISKKK